MKWYWKVLLGILAVAFIVVAAWYAIVTYIVTNLIK